MQLFIGLLVLAAVVAALRVYMTVRKLGAQRADDWDERLVKNLRAQGGDPFKPYDVDFFFDLPDQPACERVSAVLQTREYTVDFRRVDPERGDRFTLHAKRNLRVSALALAARSPVALVNGQLGFRVSYNGRSDYAGQGLTNLIDWSVSFVTNSPAMPFWWMDTNAAGLSMQFLRIEAGLLLP